jgi:hypothetical protein
MNAISLLIIWVSGSIGFSILYIILCKIFHRSINKKDLIIPIIGAVIALTVIYIISNILKFK